MSPIKPKLKKMNFLLEEDVIQELQALIPRGKKSKVVNEALKKELLRLKRQKNTEKLLKLRRQGAKVKMSEIVESLRTDRGSH